MREPPGRSVARSRIVVCGDMLMGRVDRRCTAWAQEPGRALADNVGDTFGDDGPSGGGSGRGSPIEEFLQQPPEA